MGAEGASRFTGIQRGEDLSNSNVVDSEFQTLESGDFGLEERMKLTRELFKEVFDPSLSRHGFEGSLRRVRERKGGRLKHFFLPGIPGGEGSIKEIREGYDSRSEYLRSAGRVFLKIGQGQMWVIPKLENPYFQVSLSECSALVGVGDDNLVVAHISYSAMDGTWAVVKFMREMRIDPEEIYAIASVGEYQKKRSRSEATGRSFDPSAYTALGIPKRNVSQFEFFPEKVSEDGGWLLHNLTQVIGCKDVLFKYSFDLREKRRPDVRVPQKERSGDYKNEEIIRI